MPRHVVVTLIATILFALSVAFRVWGQEEELRGLDVKSVSICRSVLGYARAPCVILSNPEEADVLYIAVFDSDGTEVHTIVRHDIATGKQVVVWPRAVSADPSASRYPQRR